ncbi:hypothetical protein GCM10009844_23830 [Nocardioides koreensis]|uniref:DEAD/DEAH box helicase n=1 Tax=Nocardioides koreensis TaxID=433651 RepID=A0ABP5LLD0_9ACTN
MSGWAGVGEGLAAEVAQQSDRCLATYREDASRVEQDAAIETSTAQGGYGRKQLYELIQNGADALLGSSGRIHVVLSRACLYVANEGKPMTPEGVSSLMASHLSRKRGDEIGRFGLGFKSVVAISDNPQIFSRSGSFGFDRELARTRINAVVPGAPSFPMLRLAEPLDADRIAENDAILAELMQWATTVVRVPLIRGYEHLAEDVAGFPPEFLLFSPHATEVRLQDLEAHVDRILRVTRRPDASLVLVSEGRESVWRVASREHRPSRAALEDAGELAHRERIKVWWAVPMSGRASVGQLWAFFPTEDRTTLSGIVNAPWKMGDDRRNLLPGQFNAEILTEVLPALIASEWHHLLDQQDPCSVLDVLPARGRESRSWADGVVNEPVFKALQGMPSLPDDSGQLTKPSLLRLHPSGIGEELLQLWGSLEPRPARWVHHGIDKNPERRLKAERLVGESASSRASITEWIEALTDDASVQSSATAIMLVAAIMNSRPELTRAARAARVVLLEDSSLAPIVAGQIFVRASAEDAGFNFIHPDLAHLPAVNEALARMGVKVLDRAGELRNLINGRRPSEIEWTRAWGLIRQCTPSVALQVLREELPAPLESSVRVKTRQGDFVPVGSAYLPGGIVSESDSRDAVVCIDTGFHRGELETLTEIGCVAQPTLRHDPPDEPWLLNYRDELRRRYLETAKGAKPQMDRLDVSGAAPPWPLQPFGRLSSRGRMALTSIVLGLTSGDPWIVRHQSNAAYEPKRYMNAVYWAVMQHGRFDTAFGPMPSDACLLPSEELPTDVLPIVDLPETVSAALRIKSEPGDLGPEAWKHMLAVAARWEDTRRAFRFYAWAVYFAEAPETIKAQVGRRSVEVPTREVAVVTSEETFHALTEQSLPVVLVDDVDDAKHLQSEWELEDGARLLEQELVFQVSGEAQTLLDLFPKLRLYLDPDQHAVQLQTCDALDLVTATRDGMKSKPVPHAFEDGQVLVTATAPEKVLRSVSEVLQLDLTMLDIRSIIDNVREQATERLVAELRNAESDEARLAHLVGGEKLRRSLPAAAIESIEGQQGRPMTDLEMAGLVRSVHGVAALQHFKAVLEEKGLNPPFAWAGGSKARKFVTDLGFSPELAGFSTDARPAAFVVEGPAELGPLHDYQQFVTGRIKELLRGSLGRGMVSLPTGAGKTRVAVQALVEELRDGLLTGPVVWIAQSDELCEQAVESWSYIWRAMGPSHRMTIGRLWGSNDVPEVTDGFQLVVATPDKLDTKINNPDYEWLTDPTVVVVDEAHTSVAPSYTRVLDWLGRGRSRKGSRVLLGLTATPFRNTNQAETERLVARYDRNRLDLGAFEADAYTELQNRGVLARVNHQLLEGASVHFTAADRDSMDRMRVIPAQVLNKLGADTERNQRIVDSVVSLPHDWTALLFATSVENAMALAALLSHRGIPAVAISGTTDPAARRYYIEEFKQGRIRVITNYNVLTQGFDAPKVQAVYVTRPTFSANVYQQMIGRGLRGPLNGGSEEVLIVNVEDNFQQFGENLAFLEFEHLWNPDAESKVDE